MIHRHRKGGGEGGSLHLVVCYEDLVQPVCPMHLIGNTCLYINKIKYEFYFSWLCSLILVVVVVDLLFYVHGKHLRSCRDGQLT